MTSFQTGSILAMALALLPVSADAACDAKEVDDCCVSDTDCVPYPFSAVCQVVPLNASRAAELRKLGDLKSAFSVIHCEGQRLENIREQSRRAEAECHEGRCRLTDLGI